MENRKKTNIILGKRLSELRKEKHITQQALAEMVGYASFQSISNIEHGKQAIKKDIAKHFARIFNVDENFFLDVKTKYKSSLEQTLTTLAYAQQDQYHLENIILHLAALNKFSVKKKDIKKKAEELLATGNGTFKELLDDYLTFYKNGKKEFSLSLDDVENFGNHLNDVFLSHIKWNIKKNGKSQTISRHK